MEEIIKIENLRHNYGKKQVLENLSFSVKKGRIFGLLGKNGAGKTTTINIMMGFLQPQGGRCTIFGEPSHKIRPETRKRIGLLHETHLQYNFMSIGQAHRFYSAFYPLWDGGIFNALMEKLGLAPDHKIFRMSCGQRSQVTLALILAQRPELMILDDYSLGLDVGYRRLFLDYLVDYARTYGTTILITSHIIQDLERFVDDIVFLDKGKTLISSTLDEFSSSFSKYRLPPDTAVPQPDRIIANAEMEPDGPCVYSFQDRKTVAGHLKKKGFPASGLVHEPMTLEDAFIGLTGKY